jgi:SAM-dependent MidA family methyltransferase
MNQSKPPDILPEPPDELKQHSERLLNRIVARIGRDGPISFAQYMEMALYEPGLGYYSAGLHKFGPQGDFVTAPELGEVFGACLARQVKEIAGELGECNILEIGAGSGKLAAQLMTELESAKGRLTYSILETSADLREVQRRTIEENLVDESRKVNWLEQPPAEPWQGIILANEVVDALPVERFVIAGDEIRQECVTVDNGKLELTDVPAPAELAEEVRKLGPLPDGYRSEIRLQLTSWLQAVTENLQRGVAIFIDYGYPRNEFYIPERLDGTLIAHYRHRAHGDVLRLPGLQDITAFVDFSALAAAGQSAGLELLGYTSQALFLMSSGLDAVVHQRLSGDAGDDMSLNSQVKQLVLPDLMGEKFQVMAFGRDWPEEVPLRGFSFRDLHDRL